MTSSAGRTLGRYRLERLVGRGGMAEVWEARDQTLGRRVAVKIILPDLAADSRFHERFLSEARSVAALEHGNVLPIYDFGEADGEPYLVMPFLEGGTLGERLKQGDVPGAQAIGWIRQLASALDAAHAAGVLHRDVKPANVMIGASGHLLLADFGIAKSSQSGQLTATGLALGTPAYMAPELARGEAATTASDRYALGVLAYELLCGRPPFAGDNPLALLHQHLTTPVPAVSGVRSDLPLDLDPVFARILAKEPGERPPTCAALADEIAQAFGGGRLAGAGPPPAAPRTLPASPPDDVTLAAPAPGAAPRPAAVVPPTAALTPVTRRMPQAAPAFRPSGAASDPRAAQRRRPVAIVAAALVGLAIAVGLMVLASRQRSEPANPPADAGESAAATPAGDEPAAGVASSAVVGGGADAAASREDRAQEGVAATERSATSPPPAASSPAADGSSVASPPAAGHAADQSGAGDEAAAAAAKSDAQDRTADALPAPDSAFPSRPATGHWVAPPAEALAILDLIGDAWRQGRFQPALFADIERRMPGLRAASGPTPSLDLLESWVEGGNALIAGDRDAARDAVRSFFAIENPPDWSKLLPARFLPHHRGRPTDWQVALFWADPRGEARALVDDALRGAADDRNLLLARAVVEHLDGNHAEAARQAVALDPSARGPARLLLARFAGDQLLFSGDVPAAVSWYKRLLVAPDRTEIAAVLRALSEEGGPQLVSRACAEGFQPACNAGRPQPLQRPRRARQQP